MTRTDQAMMTILIVLSSGLLTAILSSLKAVLVNERQTEQDFSERIIGFLSGCVLASFGLAVWYLYLRPGE